LYSELDQAETVRVDYRTALADYYTIINQCRNMIANNRTGLNTEYMDILDSELPKKDLDGGSISYSSNFRLNDLERGDEVSEDYIANVRYMFRMQYFLYKRKKSRWMTLYEKVNMLIEHPITYEPDYLLKGLDDVDDLPVLEAMVLKPKANDKKQISLFRGLCILSLLFSIFVLTTEATIIWDP
jgi:hypothetical protein